MSPVEDPSFRIGSIGLDIERQSKGDLMLQFVSRLCGRGPSVLAMLPSCASLSLVDKFLEMDVVAGIFGNQEAVAACPADRRRLLLPPTGKWPKLVPNASMLVVAESLRVVSWQWLFGALRSGVGVVVTLENGGAWRRMNLWHAFLSQIALRTLRRLIQVLVFGNNGLARFWWQRAERSVRSTAGAAASTGNGDTVVLVIGSLSAGGAERQVVLLANQLAQLDVPVSILVQRLATEEERHFLGDLVAGVRVVELPRSGELLPAPPPSSRPEIPDSVWMRMSLPPSFLDEAGLYRRLIAREHPRVVHCWLDATNVVAGLAAVSTGVPKVLLGGRNLAPFRFRLFQPCFRPLYRLLLSLPNVVMLNNSRAGLVDYANWLDVDEASMHVVYNGFVVPADRSADEHVSAWKSAHDLAGSGPVIGGVLRFSEEKDPLCWVEVAHRVLRRWPEGVAPPRFLMIGDGPLWEEAVAHAKRQGIFEHFVFLKRESRMALAMSAMDVLLLTSRDEGTPNVLIEAQALGLPVVTTDAGGCPETVLDGRTGWVVKAGDRDALAERVISALLEPEWRERARACAPAFIESRFGNRRLVEEMCRLYGIECV